MFSRLTLLAAVLFAALLSGCVTMRDPESSQATSSDLIATVPAGQTVGQTFVSRRPGLNAAVVWIKPDGDTPASGVLTVTLATSPDAPLPLQTLRLDFNRRAYPLRLVFAPRADPAGQAYYLELRSDLPMQVYGRAEEAYPGGKFYLNRTPYRADMAFQTSYDYGPPAMLTDLGTVLANLWLVIPLLLAFWMPGALLLELYDWLRDRPPEVGAADPAAAAAPSNIDEAPDPDNSPPPAGSSWSLRAALVAAWRVLDGPEANPPGDFILVPPLDLDRGGRSALAAGLSLALPAVILLWTSAAGLHWSRAGLLAAYGLLAVAWLGLVLRRLQAVGWKPAPFRWQEPALLVIFLFSLGVRLAMVRDLAAPAWVDSVHHALFVRLILENGAYPSSFAPYLNIPTTLYHTGFHASIAVFEWLSGLDLPDALLLAGQVLNALSVPAVYLFTLLVTRDRLAGVLAALFTGTLSLMPAYYASWGRYTQLAGLLVLPVALYFLWSLAGAWQSGRWSRPFFVNLLLASLACGGLLLIHYRVLGFLALLLVAWGLAELLHSLNRQPLRKSLPALVLPVLLAAGLAVLLTLPWWPAGLPDMLVPVATAEAPGAVAETASVNLGLINPIFGQQALWLAGVGMLWALLRKRWFAPILALWVALLYVVVYPANLGWQHGTVWNTTTVEIMLFIPIAALAGYLVASLLRLYDRAWPDVLKPVGRAILVIPAIALALAGAQRLLPILNTDTLLFRLADRPALAWAAANLPPGEQVLINPFFWGNGAYAGQDGGFWMAPLAGLPSFPPPVLYQLRDDGSTNRALQQVIDKARDPTGLQSLLHTLGIRYIYLGWRGGILSPRLLTESQLFQPIYTHQDVWIFEVK